tara:strand:+ start:344 stop:703 length:360 start_codon:yes stop_codon:yes gene_type:complete
MKNPTLFIDIQGPVAKAILQVAELFGAKGIDILVDDQDVEADIAITDSVSKALRIVGETEDTAILIATASYKGDMAQITAFASRYERVSVVDYIGGENGLVPIIANLVFLLTKVNKRSA